LAKEQLLRSERERSLEQDAPAAEITGARRELLSQLEEWLEPLMVALGFVWLALLIFEFTVAATPAATLLSNIIWGIFIVDFLIKLLLAPDKLPFLRRNWLTLISLLLPALRIFAVFRAVRVITATRGLRLVRTLTSLNRSVKSLRASLGRRHLGYALALTALMLVTGAAAIFALERGVNPAFNTVGDSLWWTSMLLTTIGTGVMPATAEGRLLTLLLAAYGAGFFGYVTAALASYFVGRDAETPPVEPARGPSLDDIHLQIQAMRDDLANLQSQLQSGASTDKGGAHAQDGDNTNPGAAGTRSSRNPSASTKGAPTN
jgi:voltage-gated potassium channel